MGIRVFSEITKLKKVLLHRPGRELLNITPDTLEDLLFDDIPFLDKAIKEHDDFAKVLKDNGVEVIYLEELMAQTLNHNPSLRDKFLAQFLLEANITGEYYTNLISDYLNENYKDNYDFVLKTMEGMRISELPKEKTNTLIDRVNNDDGEMLLNPLPNLYFQRDPFASIGNGISLHHMCFKNRQRETIYAEYIFNYHPDYKDIKKYYDRFDNDCLEGGDILNLSEKVIGVGISQRSNPDAVEKLSKKLLFDNDSKVQEVLAFVIPKTRAFMHLDTVFTQLDIDKFAIHPEIMSPLQVFKILPADENKLNIIELKDDISNILAKALEIDKVTLLPCGGNDKIAAKREQWNDASNTLCIAPGKIITYERNTVTNDYYRKNGLEVIEIESSELSRGRGGPRCMSMPLERE